MGVEAILKLLHVYMLATVKYFLTFPYALIIGLDSEQAIIAVTIGGITGFIFFYYFSGFLIRYYKKHHETVYCTIKHYIRIDICHMLEKQRQKPFSSKRKRTFVKLRAKYGLWGIIVMTPIVLSIPIGAFLLNKYYSRKKNVFAYMMISILGWAAVFSIILIIFPKIA